MIMSADTKKKKKERKKTRDCLSSDDTPGLVGCLILFLLCCRRWLLWKRRGSFTVRPHAPQRPGAAASINLLSISCALHSAYRLCLWLQPARLPPPRLCAAAMINCFTLLHSIQTQRYFTPVKLTAVCLVSVFLPKASQSCNDVFIKQTDVLKMTRSLGGLFGCECRASQTQI